MKKEIAMEQEEKNQTTKNKRNGKKNGWKIKEYKGKCIKE